MHPAPVAGGHQRSTHSQAALAGKRPGSAGSGEQDEAVAAPLPSAHKKKRPLAAIRRQPAVNWQREDWPRRDGNFLPVHETWWHAHEQPSAAVQTQGPYEKRRARATGARARVAPELRHPNPEFGYERVRETDFRLQKGTYAETTEWT